MYYLWKEIMNITCKYCHTTCLLLVAGERTNYCMYVMKDEIGGDVLPGCA